MDRRHFLKSSAAALALSAISSLAYAGVEKPKRVGLIGCGWYGQCDLFPLIQVAPVDVVALCDVDKKMLAEAAEMVSGRQWLTQRRYYTYGVVARGQVQEVPIEWRYYLVAEDTGHRISVATTIEGAKATQLGQTDRQLVEALELFPPVVNGTQASAGAGVISR